LNSAFELPLPSRLRTKFKCSSNVTYLANSASGDGNAVGFLWYGNGLISLGSAVNYPLGTLTAFSSNYPSGLRYLLGSDSAAGAVYGAYGSYLVHGSSMELEIVPLSGNSKPLSCVLLTTDQIGAAGPTMTTSQCSEQPFSTRVLVPATLSSTVPVLRGTQTTSRQLGLAPQMVMPGVGSVFTGTYNANPNQPWFWMLQMNNIDSSTSQIQVGIRFTLIYDVELFDLNNLTTTAPA
jgi:hypothetical protein